MTRTIFRACSGIISGLSVVAKEPFDSTWVNRNRPSFKIWSSPRRASTLGEAGADRRQAVGSNRMREHNAASPRARVTKAMAEVYRAFGPKPVQRSPSAKNHVDVPLCPEGGTRRVVG